ncbi:MAG TPA: phosphate acyltransferase PlsX [Fibrobacteria bacterium]|nr:phosphate acyltransferase PlsX [Fibrobacteria bacterium]
MIKVALDAMGGDYAPKAVIEGAIQAAKDAQGKYTIVLAGPQDVIREQLASFGYAGEGLEIHHAPDLVAMDDTPTSVLKTKQNSGLVACVSLQKAGKAQASISAGNSGAMMAACLMVLGRVGNIPRPAIACDVPSFGKKITLLDCGANVDEKPQALVAFGICGSIYSQEMLGRQNPTVGLLNMGEEEKKGTEVLQETHQLLKSAPLNFIGNVEGRDIMKGACDVIVTPGYTGNVVLKLMEGFYEYHVKTFGIIDSPAGKQFHHDWDYANFGAAMLLGLNGTGLITHGRADAKVIRNGLDLAFRLASAKVSEKIAAKLAQVA